MVPMRVYVAVCAVMLLLSAGARGQDGSAVLVVYVEGIETFDGDIRVDLFGPGNLHERAVSHHQHTAR
ncbi:hypothetical protein BH24PSE2_BH24PSE2_15810 [soil metagenome]